MTPSKTGAIRGSQHAVCKLDTVDCPQEWLTTTLAAIQKKGKHPADPQGYRSIGLESCLLKTLTLLIDRRMREWDDEEHIVPPLQNGFRPGHRTENNIFTLRAAIEQARSQGKTLWVAFVDLTNAFPSVDQSTLWAKLRDLGAGGPLFDWLRMLYTRMRYFVRHNGEYSDLFEALAGILAGDPASPILWNLFFADFTCPEHPDDVWLAGMWIPYLAQADDILLMSTSPEGLQSKLTALALWCTRNGLKINVVKTFLMAFGPLPPTLPRIILLGTTLRLVKEVQYVGMTLNSTMRNLFAGHRTAQMKKGRKVAHAALSLESYIGPIPPHIARKLYNARVDPHLRSGATIDLDVNTADLHDLEVVQHTFARRISKLPSHTAAVPVLLDVGLRPLRYLRTLSALGLLEHYVGDTAPAAPKAALACSIALANAGHTSWIGDMYHMLRALPVPVQWNFRAPITPQSVQATRQLVLNSLQQHTMNALTRSTKLGLWSSGILPCLRKSSTRAPPLDKLYSLRAYTAITSISRRRAVARLLAGVPPYAIEALRKLNVPRERRVCRFCRTRATVEDEEHILFACPDATLASAREDFLRDVLAVKPGMRWRRGRASDWQFLATCLLDDDLAGLAADLVHATFERCKEVPVYEVLSEAEWEQVPNL